MNILNYVYYRRHGDDGNPYLITCLVAQFSRANPRADYLAAAMFALRNENRKEIPEIDRDSTEGKELLRDLSEIVQLRNEQATRKLRPLLPAP